MKSERNTNPFVVDKMWIRVEIASFYFRVNDHNNKFNTIEKLQEFLVEAKAKSVGFEDVTVRGYAESECYQEDSSYTDMTYLKVYGYRYETDAEQKKRLESEIIRMRNEKRTFEQRALHYVSDGLFGSPYDKKLSEFQQTVNQLTNK